MPRPKKERNTCLTPNMIKCFAPINKKDIDKSIETVDIYCDEIEAIKLINLDGMCMKTWWKKLWVSASTFNRILNSAYKKITDAIINSKSLVIKQNK